MDIKAAADVDLFALTEDLVKCTLGVVGLTMKNRDSLVKVTSNLTV